MEENGVEYNIRSGLKKLWKWKFWIVGACIVAGGVSIFFSLKLSDEFRSSVSFVPPSFSSLGTMTFGNGIGYSGFYSAEEEDIDRTIDYLTSYPVVDSVARKFNLYKHYGIDVSSYKKDKMFYLAYFNKIDIDFSGNSTVVIDVWDVNPKLSFDIAMHYLQVAKDYFEDVSRRKIGLKATERALREMEEERFTITDSLASLRTKYGIYKLDNTGEAIAAKLAKRMDDPNFHKYYDDVKTMEIYLSTLELRYGDLQREYMTRKLNMEQYPSLIWVTKEPTVPTFKKRPKRSIIVIMATLATFVLACFLVVVLDRKKY